jgi:hypothetical protein
VDWVAWHHLFYKEGDLPGRPVWGSFTLEMCGKLCFFEKECTKIFEYSFSIQPFYALLTASVSRQLQGSGRKATVRIPCRTNERNGAVSFRGLENAPVRYALHGRLNSPHINRSSPLPPFPFKYPFQLLYLKFLVSLRT